ncbi:hypothetical protein ACH5RR_000240 [Cinchona calisaya]|uniref:F-box domain-containing protein n=1 Tax=Cinchona calisaya TaxID=153742 RepID=A0ABD3B087_9GENT
MGANASSISASSAAAAETNGTLFIPPLKPKLSDIPEACVASVLSYLDPPEICNLARLNRAFRDASSADFIWISKLPSNYPFLLKLLLIQDDQEEPFTPLAKRDVFALLSKPHSFDSGSKEVWIDKRTGGVCLSISWKAMTITGIDDRRKEMLIFVVLEGDSNNLLETEKFQTIAYLQQIWWLEVVGDFEFQFPAGKYSLFFRLQLGRATKRLGRRVCTSDNMHGWDIKPVQFHFTTSDGQHATTRCVLDTLGSWVHYHVGDFIVEDSNASMRERAQIFVIDSEQAPGNRIVVA